MNETETLEIPEQNAILQAIMKRFDDVDMQLEVMREGIAFNSAAYDKLEAKFFDARSDITFSKKVEQAVSLFRPTHRLMRVADNMNRLTACSTFLPN